MKRALLKWGPKWLQRKTKQRKYWVPTVIGLCAAILMMALYISTPKFFTQSTELLFDSYQRMRPREYKPDLGVRIVDIDEESLKRHGQWPWPRTKMAEFNDKLAEAGAAVIAYDIVFAEPDRTSPENLIEVFQNNPEAKGDFANIKALTGHDQVFADAIGRSNVVTGFFLVNEENAVRPVRRAGMSYGGTDPRGALPVFNGAIPTLPVLEAQAKGTGTVSFQPGDDGIVRAAPLFSMLDGKAYPSLSVEALRAAQGAGAYKIRGNDASGESYSKIKEVVALQVGAFELPTTKDGALRLYFSERQKDRIVPAWKVLSAESSDPIWQKLTGHIVFVGTSAEGLKDMIATPIQPRLAGVEAHAQVVEQILGEQFLRRPDWTRGLEICVFLFLGIFLAFTVPRLGAAKGALLSAVLSGSVFYGSWFAFAHHQLLFDPILVLLGILALYIATTIASFYLTETERSRIRSAFSMYLSPKMVKKVSEDPSLLSLGGEDRNMTILFLDIRGFSKISEGMSPQEITTFLNIFLTPMTNILQAGKATIDKYIGDAIVAFWNAPLDDDKHEENAARCVLKMMQVLDELNAKYMSQTDVKWPENVRVGIGLNTGVCCVGNLGSEQRFSYSMIGDAANLTSRIEGLTKQYKVDVLIGDNTAKTLDGFALIEADLIQVVGRRAPERIFILVGDKKIASTDAFKAYRKQHKCFLKAYRAQDWGTVRALIPDLQTLSEPFGCAQYYGVLAERIAAYEAAPTIENWDGIYIATHK